MASVRSISSVLVVDIGTEMDNDVVERRLNARVSVIPQPRKDRGGQEGACRARGLECWSFGG